MGMNQIAPKPMQPGGKQVFTNALGVQNRVQPRNKKPGMDQVFDQKVKASMKDEIDRKKARAANNSSRLQALDKQVSGIASDNASIMG